MNQPAWLQLSAVIMPVLEQQPSKDLGAGDVIYFILFIHYFNKTFNWNIVQMYLGYKVINQLKIN